MRDSNFLLLSRTAFLGNQEYWSGVADDPQASAIRKEIAALMSCLEKLVISDKLTPRKLTAWKNTRIIKRDAAYAGLAAIKQQSGQRRSRDLEPSALE